MALTRDIFDDAALLLERARRHIGEFGEAAYRDPTTKLWDVVITPVAGEWIYELVLNRDTLRLVKPIVGDIANNLVHALDQVVAAASRLNAPDRNRSIYYPIDPDDARFDRKLNDLVSHLAPEWISFIRAMREKPVHHQRHLLALKHLSNTSKHWALVVGSAQALAVSWQSAGAGAKIVNIPSNYFTTADRFEFWRGAKIVSNGFTIGLKLELAEFDADTNVELSSLFEIGASFVERVIREARTLSTTAP